MFKSINLMINFYPIILNILIFLMYSLPYKNNKFNPINLMMILILSTILISLKMNIMINSWTSFILFLIMIGGMMIIYMYIVSLTNNMLFKMNYKNLLVNFIKFLIFMMIIILLNNFNKFNNYYLWFNNYNFLMNLNLYETYMSCYNNSTIFIISYLFYSMICIMNICYKFKAPLRQLFF